MKKFSYVLVAVAACFVFTDMAFAQRTRRGTQDDTMQQTTGRSVGRSGRAASKATAGRSGRGTVASTTRGRGQATTSSTRSSRSTAGRSGRTGTTATRGRSGRSGQAVTTTTTRGRGQTATTSTRGTTRNTRSAGRSGRSGQATPTTATRGRGQTSTTTARGRRATRSAGRSGRTGTTVRTTGRSGQTAGSMVMSAQPMDAARSGRTRVNMTAARSAITTSPTITTSTGTTTTTTEPAVVQTLAAQPDMLIPGVGVGAAGMIRLSDGTYATPSAVNYYNEEQNAYGQKAVMYTGAEAQQRADAEKTIANVEDIKDRYFACMDEFCMDTVEQNAKNCLCSSAWDKFAPKKKKIDQMLIQLNQFAAQIKSQKEFGDQVGVDPALQAATDDVISAITGELGIAEEKVKVDTELDLDVSLDMDSLMTMDSLIDYGTVGKRKEGAALYADASSACNYILDLARSEGEKRYAKKAYETSISNACRAYDVSLDKAQQVGSLKLQQFFNTYQQVKKRQQADKSKYNASECLAEVSKELQKDDLCGNGYENCYTPELLAQQKLRVQSILDQCQTANANDAVWNNIVKIALGRGTLTATECATEVRACIANGCGENYEFCPSLSDVALYEVQCKTTLDKCQNPEETWQTILTAAETSIRLNCNANDNGYWSARQKRCITQGERDSELARKLERIESQKQLAEARGDLAEVKRLIAEQNKIRNTQIIAPAPAVTKSVAVDDVTGPAIDGTIIGLDSYNYTISFDEIGNDYRNPFLRTITYQPTMGTGGRISKSFQFTSVGGDSEFICNTSSFGTDPAAGREKYCSVNLGGQIINIRQGGRIIFRHPIPQKPRTKPSKPGAQDPNKAGRGKRDTTGGVMGGRG